VIVPIFLLDSGEKWLPVPIETILTVNAKIDGQPLTSLDQLTSATKRIDFPAGMTQPKGATPTVYHRAVPAANLWWHQFWTWWLYNPKEYLGFGMHEGDWEMVQIGCDDQQGDKPVLMTYSQHKSGQKHEYWSGVQLEAGRPKVYVAVGSHANYYSVHHDEVDDADGRGVRVDPQVDEFGAWATWNGQWGNSDNSPGPLPSHLSWRAPHQFHSQAH
jgi:hypothetical protein